MFSRYLICAALCAAGQAQGAGAPGAPGVPRAYAVISEVGGEINLVQSRQTTGGLVDSNRRQRIALPQGNFDKIVLFAARDAPKAGSPLVSVWLVAPIDSDLFDAQADFSEGAQLRIPDDLAAAMREQHSTHLLLFTRYRAPASLESAHAWQGTGTLEGVGFYVNTDELVARSDTAERAAGYLAPYAYFRATLVDTATGRVLRTRTLTSGHVVAAARGKGPNLSAWNALDANEKTKAIGELRVDGVRRTVPELLAR